MRRHLLHDHHQRDLLQGPRVLTTRRALSLFPLSLPCAALWCVVVGSRRGCFCRRQSCILLTRAPTCCVVFCVSRARRSFGWSGSPGPPATFAGACQPSPRPCCAVLSLTSPLIMYPPIVGHVRYINGVFRFGIDATSLTPWGTKIPDEPSYVILNTAISTSWGFPNPPWGYVLRHTSCVVRFFFQYFCLLCI